MSLARAARLSGAGLAVTITAALAACGGDDETRPAPREDAGRTVVLVDEPFVCGKYPQPVDLVLVKVTMTQASTSKNREAIRLSRGECTGRIGRIEVDTWRGDGVKVHADAHDLVIEGGYVRCHDRVGAVHQDGIQAMGGRRVTFQDLLIDCRTPQGSALFVNLGRGGRALPMDVVCDGCTLTKGPTRNRVVRINRSVRSGLRNSKIISCGDECPGPALLVGREAIDPVTDGNQLLVHESR